MNIAKIILATLLAIALPMLVFSFQKQKQHLPAIKINNVIIPVEIADTPVEQVHGLSNRDKLAPDSGMLFKFPNKKVLSFWMKNMRFPIDIIWIDGQKIVNISESILPEGEIPVYTYSSVFPVDHVLEVNAGFCELYGIEAGEAVEFIGT